MTRPANSRAWDKQVRDFLNELETRERVTKSNLADHIADPDAHGLRAYQAPVTNTTLDLTDRIVEAAAPNLIFTLPTAVGITGKDYIIKNYESGALTVDADGTETIDGGLTAVLNTAYESITVISNGTNWIIV